MYKRQPENSIYGHPHREVLERIEAKGADWYQTGLSGAVRVEVIGGQMKVQEFIGRARNNVDKYSAE